MMRLWVTISTLSLIAAETVAVSPFATQVISYDPAPGQYAQDPNFTNPFAALGGPSGGGTTAPDNTSQVSLGGFGGEIVLGFDHAVEDGYHNRRCLDAIVFGNAFYLSGDPYRRWAEAGVIEISVDANQNGLADDAWYLVPGSHLEPNSAAPLSVTWDDDTGDATFPPSSAAWIPPGYSGIWTTTGFMLPGLFNGPVVMNPLGTGSDEEGTWGYADHTPTLVLGDLDGDNIVDDPNATPESFYSVPDDPHGVGISPGSGGGDAFDIADAIDPNTGMPAGLSHFDFIRIRTGIDVIGIFAESSTEIDAVSDVAAGKFGDSDWDEDVDAEDWAMFELCYTGPNLEGELDCPCRMNDADLDATVDVRDFAFWQIGFGR
jgi:hypothetical protein